VGKKCVLQLCSQRLDPSAGITLYNQLRNLYDDNKKEKKNRERESFDRSHDSFKSYKKKKTILTICQEQHYSKDSTGVPAAKPCLLMGTIVV